MQEIRKAGERQSTVATPDQKKPTDEEGKDTHKVTINIKETFDVEFFNIVGLWLYL